MPGLTLSKKAQKILGQIRYRPTLRSLEATKSAAKELEAKYPEWEVSGDSEISLFRSIEKVLISFKHDSITYINEENEDFGELSKHLQVSFEKNIQPAGVEEVRHVGVRNVLVFETNFEFSELAGYLHELFYKEPVSNKISAEKINDMQFAVDGAKNGFMNHVRIGPVQDKEGMKYFNTAFPKRDFSLSGGSFLFMDIDVYVGNDSKNPKKTAEQINALVVENKRIVSEYLELIKS